MRATDSMRKATVILAACLSVLALQGCGGGSAFGNPTPVGQPGRVGTSTRTRTPTPTLRQGTLPPQVGTPTRTRTGTSGSGAATPTPLPLLTIVFPGEDIAAAAKQAPPGSLVAVAPGLYRAFAIGADDQLQGQITIVADVTGVLTNTNLAQPVTINAGTHAAGIEITGQSDVPLDGFTVRGGTEAGIKIANGTGITVRNCVVTSSKANTPDGGDGVRFEGSADGLVFNNAIFNKAGAGIQVVGTDGLRAINNSLYANATGLSVGEAGEPSSNVTVENNIIHKNGVGIVVTDDSAGGFETNFNLNSDGYQGAQPGQSDFSDPHLDPLFIAPSQGDFHLAPGSLAIDGGDDAIGADLLDLLDQRTTLADGTPDCVGDACGGIPGHVDQGFHYPAPIKTPTTKPKATPTRTRTPTHGPTP